MKYSALVTVFDQVHYNGMTMNVILEIESRVHFPNCVQLNRVSSLLD